MRGGYLYRKASTSFLEDGQHYQFRNYMFIFSSHSENTPSKVVLTFSILTRYNFRELRNTCRFSFARYYTTNACVGAARFLIKEEGVKLRSGYRRDTPRYSVQSARDGQVIRNTNNGGDRTNVSGCIRVSSRFSHCIILTSRLVVNVPALFPSRHRACSRSQCTLSWHAHHRPCELSRHVNWPFYGAARPCSA